MKSPCIAYPGDEPLVLIRASQVRICDGNHCAAALLSYFGYWHSNRLDQIKQAEHVNKIAALHGEAGTQDTTLFQYHTEDDIEAGLLHLYGRKTIRTAIALLTQKGFLSLHTNPNPRYRFDRTHYFLFHPGKVQTEIGADTHQVKMPDREIDIDEAYVESKSSQVIDVTDEVKMPDREGTSASWSGKNTSWSGKNASTIPEITSEITHRDPNSPSLSPSHDSQPRQDAEAISQMEAGFQTYSVGFESVCLAHPKQPIEGKRLAFGIWKAKNLEPRASEIAQKLARLVVTKWRDRTYYPLLKTWLANSGYDDELVPLEDAEPTPVERPLSKGEQRQKDILSNMPSLIERTKAYEATRSGQILPGPQESRTLLPRYTD
jgi:hypothetical protein